MTIRIRGARTHNLKNVSLDLPRHKLVVVTGLSGSGKSSLAFDTLYAEGHRRYVESLSAYARQFLQLMDKPDVDLIEGLSPAISIEQKAAGHNPRSTVGTITEIHDYLRLLYARVGTPYCPDHGLPLQAQSVSQMVDAVLSWTPETRLAVLAPIARGKKGSFEDECASLQAQGYVRLRVDGQLTEIDGLTPLKKTEKHDIDVVIDRLRIKPESKQRLAESFETALQLAEGRALALDMDSGREQVFSSRYACPVCSHSLPELEPRLFSFNNPMGACPSCDGIGQVGFFDPKRVVAFPELSLAAGAIRGWDRRNAFTHSLLTSLAAHYEFDIEAPFEDLPEALRDKVLYGSGEEEISFLYLNEKGRSTVKRHTFEGVIPNLERRWRETDSATVREELGKYRNIKTCPDCGGSRLRPEARNVLIGHDPRDGERHGQAIYEVEAMPLSTCLAWFRDLNLTGAKQEIAQRIVREIEARLSFLNNVGLNYLSLDRSADTISGGEAQRIRLASQIGSGLTGVMYVLDEPSIGLHQRDNDRLIGTLQHLRDLGNSVIVVEHDEDMIRMADWVVDMGPGAGEHGGEVVAQGDPETVQRDPHSLTGQYLSGAMRYASGMGLALWLRPQDPWLARGATVASGAYAERLGLEGLPPQAETLALHTIFELQRATGARVHLTRLSSAAGLALLRAAKRQGLPVTADVSANSLHLTDVDIGFFNTDFHLNPPLRGQRDRDAIQAALADGTVDALCSDHTPVGDAAKAAPFPASAPGATGLELLLSLTLKWARDHRQPLAEALARVTSGPAAVLDKIAPQAGPAGHLGAGVPADLCLADLDAEWLVTPGALQSSSGHTPFAGMMLPGRVRATVVGGSLAWETPV